MEQTREKLAQNLAERWCWQVARRDDSRVARRLYRKQGVDGVYRLDEGAVLDDFFYCLHELGVIDLLGHGEGTAIQREMVPVVQYVLLYRRGAAKRQGPRTAGPICPDALAESIVKLNVRDLEALFNGVIRALAKTGIFQATVTGMVDATDLETMGQYAGSDQVTRTRKITDKRGRGYDIEGTVYGWKLIVLLEARTKIALAATVVPIHEPEGLSRRALVTQARTNLAGYAHRHKVVFDKGCLDGTELWWLEQQGILFVVPAQDQMAVTTDARAPAAAGEGMTQGRRVHAVRHGQGKATWTERLVTEVVGITGLTTDDPYGTAEHGRHHSRRDFQANPINAVVVRQWNGRDDGPRGKTVFLTNAPVGKPLQPFDDDDRRLIENCCIKESKQPWSLKHPPQKTARAVRVHVVFTLRLFALATGYRWQCEPVDTAGEPAGWQRWRCQLLQHTRDQVIIFAQGAYGIFHLAEYSLLLGVRLKDRPPGVGTRPQVLAKYRFTAAHG